MNRNIKNIAAVVFFALLGTSAIAQVSQQKIGQNPLTINPSAALEIESSNKGLLLPRLELTATDNFAPLTAHVEGMTIYNTATAGTGATAVTPGYYYNDGTKWVRIATGADAKTEPWYVQATNAEATLNTQNIYQMGSVAVGKNAVQTGAALDVEGAVRGGTGHTGAVGINSVVFGKGNTASGENSSAFGTDNQVTGHSGTVIGNNNISTGNNELVLGTYNAITTGSTALLQIGNGNSTTRSNALTVLSNGNIGTDLAIAPTERLDIGSGNVRVRDINTNTGANTDKIVVADPNGVLKTLKAAMPKFFYMPSVEIPTHNTSTGTLLTGTQTIDLYASYTEQFGFTGGANQVRSNASSTLPTLPADELDYFITYFDTDVFENVSVSALGVLTYSVKSDAIVTPKTFMNIVFKVRD